MSADCGANTFSVTAGFPVIVGNGLLLESFELPPEQAARANARRLMPAIAARLRLLNLTDMGSSQRRGQVGVVPEISP
ncbi:hypothetical protein GCM10009630_18190 [Kribbella jejuensis]